MIRHIAAARTLATLTLLAGVALGSGYLFANQPPGTFGFTAAVVNGSPAVRVDAVAAGGPAARAGIHSGDVLFVPADRAAMYLFANVPLIAAGDRVQVEIVRAGVRRVAMLRAQPDTTSPRFEALFACALALPILLLGWFIIWRKPDSSDALTLGAMLLCFGAWIASPDRLGSPVQRLLLYEVSASAFVIFGVLAAALFFVRFPEGRGTSVPLRRYALALAVGATMLELGFMTAGYVLPAVAGATPWLTVPSILTALLPPLATFVCFFDAFRRADAIDRMRLRWLGGSYFIGFSGPLLLPAASLLMGPNFTIADQVACESTLFVLAIGLTYSILRRRVVDVAFVLNRALVFSLVSGIVVALFIGLEWVVGLFFTNLSRTTSSLVQVGAAVVIGFSLRPIHERVDRIIDRVFFAKRHAAETALRHLATEVHFIRDRAALLERIERDLCRYTESRLVAVYFRDHVQSDFLLLRGSVDLPEIIDADDDAAVALAVGETPIDLHGRATMIAGDLALPLAIRKNLVGILAIGQRASDEAFAPDEIETLRFLAGYVSMALAVQPAGSGADAGLAAIIEELRLQRSELRSLNEALRARTTDAGR